MTSDIKRYLTDIHNNIRQYVASGNEELGVQGQPSAANMLLMEWDDEIAEMAQRWADQCVQLDDEFQRDQCRKTAEFDVGQNILTAVTPQLEFPDLNLLVLKWYSQVGNVIPSDVHSFSMTRGIHLIGKYTQVLWAKTHYIGCGMAIYKNPKDVSNESQLFYHRLVCNYAPAGNVVGEPIYEIGKPCTKCPKNSKCIKGSLCEANNTIRKIHITEPLTVPYKLQIQDILHMDKIFSDLYEIEGGLILQDEEEWFGVDDSSDSIDKTDKSGEIYNTNEYQLVEGIWFQGRCRCNLVYRSCSFNVKKGVFTIYLVIVMCYYNTLL